MRKPLNSICLSLKHIYSRINELENIWFSYFKFLDNQIIYTNYMYKILNTYSFVC